VGPCLLPDRPTAQRYNDFLRAVQPGLVEDVPLAVRQKLWFQHNGAPGTVGKLCSTSQTRHIQEDFMASSVDVSNSDGFLPVGTPEGSCLCSPCQDYRRSRGKT
jgi:hypothetical protein